jgi:hypothetical protein
MTRSAITTIHYPESPLCFVHIPKTAGTAIDHAFKSLFRADEVFHGKTVYDYQPYSREELADYRFFSGHIQRDYFEKLPENTRYFTFLRNPVKRTISHYRYFRKIFASGDFMGGGLIWLKAVSIYKQANDAIMHFFPL